MPRNHVGNGSHLPPFQFSSTTQQFFLFDCCTWASLHTAMILHQHNESSLDKNEWRFWAAQLQVGKQQHLIIILHFLLQPAPLKNEAWTAEMMFGVLLSLLTSGAHATSLLVVASMRIYDLLAIWCCCHLAHLPCHCWRVTWKMVYVDPAWLTSGNGTTDGQ